MLAQSWSEEFFDDDFARIFLTWDDATRDATTDFLIHELALTAGQRVFDQHCGIGRVSLALADRDVRCIGVDLAENYIQTATQAAAQHGLPCQFVRGDGHEFVPDEPCDAVVNWFSSIGYSEDDGRNILVLQRAFDALKPGGRLALDFNNMVRTLREFKPHDESTHLVDGVEIQVNRYVTPDFAQGMFRMHWMFRYPDGRKVAHHGCSRMYLPIDLVRMAEACGFVVDRLLGGIDGSEIGIHGARTILIAHRPD